MEEAGFENGLGTDPRNRKAAWWCWPLIVFALLPFDRIIPFFLPAEQREKIEQPIEIAPGNADWSLFKFQSEILVGSDSLGKLAPYSGAKQTDSQIGQQLEPLIENASGERQWAALLLLDNFLEVEYPEGNAPIDEWMQELEDEPLRALVKRSLEGGIGEDERDELRSYVGWFAELAPSTGGAEPPNIDRIRSKSIVVLLVLSGFVIAGLCLLVVGACLLVYHISTTTNGKRENTFQPSGLRNGYLFEAFSLYLGLVTLGALAGAFVGSPVTIIGYVAAVLVPLFWPRIRGISWGEFCQAIGWHRGKGWMREIGAGVIGYMGVLSVASIGIMLTAALSFLGQYFAENEVGPEPHPIIGWIDEGGFLAKIACLFLAAGFAPFFEETFFRGTFHRYLRERMRFIWAALLAGVIFAALHPQGLFAIPALASMGVGFALIREWRDSLVAPMVAHAINNGLLVGLIWIVL